MISIEMCKFIELIIKTAFAGFSLKQSFIKIAVIII